MIYDISKYKIRILYNPIYVRHASKKTPIDVEGTVLKIRANGDYTNSFFNKGRVLDLICVPNMHTAGKLFIRWDNDVKSWCGLGIGILRASAISSCKSIWDNTIPLPTDNRPYHELHPRTKEVHISFFDHVETNATIKDKYRGFSSDGHIRFNTNNNWTTAISEVETNPRIWVSEKHQIPRREYTKNIVKLKKNGDIVRSVSKILP